MEKRFLKEKITKMDEFCGFDLNSGSSIHKKLKEFILLILFFNNEIGSSLALKTA